MPLLAVQVSKENEQSQSLQACVLAEREAVSTTEHALKDRPAPSTPGNPKKPRFPVVAYRRRWRPGKVVRASGAHWPINSI